MNTLKIPARSKSPENTGIRVFFVSFTQCLNEKSSPRKNSTDCLNASYHYSYHYYNILDSSAKQKHVQYSNIVIDLHLVMRK